MPKSTQPEPRPLPERPNLRHLKDEAKALVKAGEAASLSQAQFQIAKLYGFASWPKLKAHLDALEASQREFAELKQAIDENNLDRVIAMMTRNPELHRAPLGYGKNGPLTWVAECRVPWEAPTAARLEMAQWMIDNGSDVHQGGDGPMMRAALVGYRIPMMELLVRNGADVNAEWNGDFPIIFAPCETVEPEAIRWLLEHGANPNCGKAGRKYPDSALDYVIGTYSRSARLGECIDILVGAGCASRRNMPAVLELLRGRVDLLAEWLDQDPSLISKRFPDLDFGSSGARRLTLQGATLLHVAAEYGNLEAARLLVERGADVNACADLDEAGVGGQTPIFHAATQFYDWGLPVVEFLVENGADLGARAKLPGHYERQEEFVECTPLEYARLFPGKEGRMVEFLARAGTAG
jgi:ankyrin repeat protein